MARITSTTLIVLLLPLGLRAETFELRSGGEVRGELMNPDQEPRSTYTIRVSTGGDITLDATDVVQVTKLTKQQKEYARVLKKMPADTARNHWLMAEWCQRQGLKRERTFHLEKTIEHDPDHEPARKALKYRRGEDGTWARAEDVWVDSGYVKENGRWETPQVAELEAKQEARKEAVIEWQKKLKMWRGWLGGKRHSQAVRNFATLDDPLAAGPLAKMLWSETNPELRDEFAELLGKMDSSIATTALVSGVMDGEDLEFRLHCLRQLEENNRRHTAGAFISDLTSKNNVKVRRAARALATLGGETAVLPLIKALRTNHKYKVKGNPNNMNAGFNRDTSGRNGLGGLSMGGNKTRTVNRTLKNKEVRNALVKLTDQDFEYNEQTWMRWYLARTTPPQLDLRRDP